MKKLAVLIAALVVVAVVFAATASADYGRGAVYQIELSANVGGSQGGGVWLWITLNQNGTGDYAGSDCGHGGAGAASDKGDISSWSDSGGWLTINGIVLNGLGGFPTTVRVPDSYGHYRGTIGSFLTLPGFIPPFVGFSQLQVAP
jgi:hypothetical protein